MQYQELITKIAENREYLAICRNITGGDLVYKDLFQETLLILLEADEKKIFGIYRRGEIKYFLVRIFVNLYKSRNREFNQKCCTGENLYDKETEDIIYDIENDRDIEKKSVLIRHELKIKNDDDPLWYENNIFQHYLKEGNIRKLAKNTGINYQSLQTIIRKVRNRIRTKYEEADIINNK